MRGIGAHRADLDRVGEAHALSGHRDETTVDPYAGEVAELVGPDGPRSGFGGRDERGHRRGVGLAEQLDAWMVGAVERRDLGGSRSSTIWRTGNVPSTCQPARGSSPVSTSASRPDPTSSVSALHASGSVPSSSAANAANSRRYRRAPPDPSASVACGPHSACQTGLSSGSTPTILARSPDLGARIP